ncbi:MAG: nicotinate (nicotinamide) nucleotide adenylyltransferase [Sedimentisphaerales bacterium]|nr:nicotinate (nicotinamide) nucleotide adenylyltransferase [Sedimentisphaerales bacterium]
MSSDKGIVLFGGTFDPIHHGHLIACRAAAEQLEADRVILIPSAAPPHKDAGRLTGAGHRLRLAQLAVAGDDLFEISDCELRRAGPSYTLDTVLHFRGLYGLEAVLYWLIGADSLPELNGWHQIQRLAEECIIVTAARPGYSPGDLDRRLDSLPADQIDRIRRHILATPGIEISATDIRDRVRRNRSIRYLVPEAVADYIRDHRLYHGGSVAAG